MKLNLYLLLWSLAFFVSACSNNDEPPLPEPPAKGHERTVLAIWIGENNLSDYARSDFNEMVEGIKNVDVTKNNLVVYCDTQNDAPRLIHISKSAGKVLADTIHTYEEQNSLKKEILSSIISKVIDEFPAETYGLVMASHADGWIGAREDANSTRHFGDYKNTNINIPDLREVLEQFQPFEFILLDACYMQSIEVAYELRNCTDYLIGSPTEIPGPGAPYHMIVPQFFTTSNVAENIANAYYNYYGKEDGGIKKDAKFIKGRTELTWPHGVSISVLKTSELDPLASLTESILSQYAGNKIPINPFPEEGNNNGWFYYGLGRSNNGNAYYYDLDELISRITVENSQYKQWRECFDAAQTYFKTTKTNYIDRKDKENSSMEDAQGVSTYIPINENSSVHKYFRNFQWYKEANIWKSSGW